MRGTPRNRAVVAYKHNRDISFNCRIDFFSFSYDDIMSHRYTLETEI
jgi:hypothetical protein